SAYWRNECQGASSGQGYPQGWTSQWEGNQDQAWGHAAAAPPPFSNYGYPPPPYQGVMPDPSFGAQFFDLPQPEQENENHGCLCKKKHGRHRRHPEAHKPTRRWNHRNCISNGTFRPSATGII